MKHIKLFENFDTKSIEEICKKYHIYDYTINEDGSIDVNNNVYIYDTDLTELPLTFNKVSENFYIYRNKLTTLKGSPKYVGGNFRCDENDLKTLEYSPEYVGGYFECRKNSDITTLMGCPKYIGGNFCCLSLNNIETIEGIPTDFQGEFIAVPRTEVIFKILKNNLEYISNFYDFRIITDLKKFKQTLNWNRLLKFLDFYNIELLDYINEPNNKIKEMIINNFKII